MPVSVAFAVADQAEGEVYFRYLENIQTEYFLISEKALTLHPTFHAICFGQQVVVAPGKDMAKACAGAGRLGWRAMGWEWKVQTYRKAFT